MEINLITMGTESLMYGLKQYSLNLGDSKLITIRTQVNIINKNIMQETR